MVFEALNGFAKSSVVIAIDDVSMDANSTCAQAASCDFETSWCMWSLDPFNMRSDGFNLLRISGQQLKGIASARSLVKFDATTNSAYGHFLWADNSFQNSMMSIRSETLFTHNYPQGIQINACLETPL